MTEILGNRYEIIKKIGGGGMAIVYLAKDVFLDRPVAVKVLREEYIGDQDYIRRFHKEAKAVASLAHPNIVNIFDFGINNERAFLVMEYVEGETLKNYINEKGSLSEAETAEIGRQICLGVAAAHKKNIVHKDIKPHNILIEKNGTVKVTDFGIAQSAGNNTITHSKGILGSAHYFSPEQARGEQVDYKTDIYSIGVVLYEMITGKVPFGGDNPVTVALKHIQAAPALPSRLKSDISPKLEHIILRAMAKDPSQRYDSAEEMAKELAELCGKDNELTFQIAPKVPTGNILEKFVAENTLDEQAQQIVRENTEEKSDAIPKRQTKMKIKKGPLALLLVAAVLLLFGGFKFATSLFDSADDIAVPDIVGQSVLEAQKTLLDNDLTIEVEDNIYTDTMERGLIISQSPSAGTKVKAGRNVTVIVSLGPSLIEVPDLSGMTEREAKVTLESYGLTIGKTSTGYSDEYKKDEIIFQSPKAATKVEEGTTVDLIISLGSQPEAITAPNVVGVDLTQARQIILANGLLEGEITYVTSNEYYENVVVSQSISGQTLQGSTVDLTVSSGPGPEEYKTTNISFVIPQSGTIILELIDDNGTNDVYSARGEQGENFSQDVRYKDKTKKAVLNIYCADKLIDSRDLP